MTQKTQQPQAPPGSDEPQVEEPKTDAQKRLDSIQRSLGNYVGNAEAIKARAARPRGRRRFAKKSKR